ncbi:MAG: UDP-N-acetylmuramate dehydrogenase [Candidatus Paceibacterota bacterium]|jgi:UDP-N-acetylmuramate dehydrogenase
MEIKEKIKLSDYSTFRAGGDARFFCDISSVEDLKESIDFAQRNNLKFMILGGGSNILFDDLGFNGLIIKNNILGIKKESENNESIIFSFGSGEILDDAINFIVENNFSLSENLSGIPGTIGGAVFQNAGAYGVEAKDIVISVEVYDTNTQEIFLIPKEKCNFLYRQSIFKKNKNLIITKVYLKLNKNFIPNLEYTGLKDIKNTSAKDIREGILNIRKERLPDWKKLGTAGCFFKNPIITEDKYLEISKVYKDIPKFKAEEGFVKISLGYVIEKICDLKEFKIGDVGLYKKHSLTVINFKNAKSSEIKSFVKVIEEKVFEKIGIKIEREVEEIIF